MCVVNHRQDGFSMAFVHMMMGLIDVVDAIVYLLLGFLRLQASCSVVMKTRM